MKRFSTIHLSSLLAFFTLFLIGISSSYAQEFMFGPRIGFGFNTQAFENYEWELSSPSDFQDLHLRVQDASPEIQLGVYGRASLGKLYLQPELLLTTSSIQYVIEDFNRANAAQVVDERNYQLAIPVIGGIRFGWFRAQAGPVYRMRLANLSELKDFEGMERRFANSTLGVQAGLGIDLGRKVAIDLRYETSLLQARDEVVFLGQTHDLSQRSGQLVTSLGISF